jgi:dTDP-4-dehydrorhamnose reductase
MKVAVIGALGQLGADVSEEFIKNNDEVVKLDMPEIDIVDIDSVNTVLKEIKPDCIINTAAYHQPEECEKKSCKSI